MFNHLYSRVQSCSKISFDKIQEVISTYKISTHRLNLIKIAQNDNTLNPEIVSREIDLQVAFRTLQQEVESCFDDQLPSVDQMVQESKLKELIFHCQLQIFRTEMFRTKRNQGETSSIYFENV